MILIHADWSVAERKRWLATARKSDATWTIEAVRPVGATAVFVRSIIDDAKQTLVIAGFDFPIGVPAAYGERTGLADFPSLLQAIGEGEFGDFAKVAREPEEITTTRPFYPAGATAGLKQQALLTAHAAATLNDLRRECERATADRRAACPLFWTLGGSQVGRAALAGWIDVVKPALALGASLWPFHGTLSELTDDGRGLVLVETYPAEAYGHVGVDFRADESKRRQSDRERKAPAIMAWAERRGVRLAPAVAKLICDGFGADAPGEDRFDALLGLLGMMEVVDGRREAAPALSSSARTWEGWIFGQRA